MVEILLVIIIVLLLIVVYLLISRGRIEPKDIELAISNVWRKSGLDEKVGALTVHAEEIKKDYRSLEQMLRVPVERASLGELVLEEILSDQLPSDVFGIRKKILNGKIPDAHVKSTAGIICIDSKFPLDNYKKMMEAPSEEKDRWQKLFFKDVRKHFDKIAKDYVCPGDGSAEFAFAFIPSESIYYFLVTDAYDTLRTYTAKGVQVVSPLTLSHKIELIKAGIHARKLTEQAEEIRKDIFSLAMQFEDIDKNWRTFYETHLKNAQNKADEVNQAYKNLKEEFEKISRLSKN